MGIDSALIFVSAIFLFLAARVETTWDDPWGPKLVPLVLAAAMLISSLLSILWQATRTDRKVTGGSEAPVSAGNMPQETGLLPFGKLAKALLLGLAYSLAMTSVGYLVSTACFLFLSLLLFENRNLLTAAILGIAGSAVYDLLFIWLVGLSDPDFDLFAFLSKI